MITAFFTSQLFMRFAPYIFGALIAIGLALTLYGFGYTAGKRVVMAEFNEYRAMIAARDLEAERLAIKDLAFRTRQAEVIVEEVLVEVEKIRTVYRNITKEVTVYVPSDSCELPAGWRLLHDAAAEGRDPEPPGSPDAAPVPAQDAAITVIENYESCRINAERLEGLQQWVREVAGAHVSE